MTEDKVSSAASSHADEEGTMGTIPKDADGAKQTVDKNARPRGGRPPPAELLSANPSRSNKKQKQADMIAFDLNHLRDQLAGHQNGHAVCCRKQRATQRPVRELSSFLHVVEFSNHDQVWQLWMVHAGALVSLLPEIG